MVNPVNVDITATWTSVAGVIGTARSNSDATSNGMFTVNANTNITSASNVVQLVYEAWVRRMSQLQCCSFAWLPRLILLLLSVMIFSGKLL